MTLEEVADLHRVATRTVRRWIGSGKLAAKRLPGGAYRIDRSDAEALAAPVVATSTDTEGGDAA